MKGFRINPDKKYVDIILNGLEKKKVDFYVVKGICEELLDYAASDVSQLDGGMREGIVLRTKDGKQSFKAVSNEFLLKYHG